MMNGTRGKEIVCKKRLRQGDPLSLLIFVLIADGLNHIAKCRKEGMLKGLECRDEANRATNLQYADDMLLFGIVSFPQALVLKGVLSCYKLWSGLKINFQKNSLIFLRDISASNFLIISLVFKCPVQRLPITYLGLSLSTSSLNKQLWRPLIDKIQKRLAGWKGRMLSL